MWKSTWKRNLWFFPHFFANCCCWIEKLLLISEALKRKLTLQDENNLRWLSMFVVWTLLGNFFIKRLGTPLNVNENANCMLALFQLHYWIFMNLNFDLAMQSLFTIFFYLCCSFFSTILHFFSCSYWNEIPYSFKS